ncbi:hypothetical protein ABKN59_001102 [Abortiporus biennis]
MSSISLKRKSSQQSKNDSPDTHNSKRTKLSYPCLPEDVHLSISTLAWDGEPMEWDADGNEPEPFGRYVCGKSSPAELGLCVVGGQVLLGLHSEVTTCF